MRSEWQKVAVSEIAVPILGGTPAKAQSEYWNGGTIPWATAKDIASVTGRFINATNNNITWQGLENSAAKLLPFGTIVITARGTVGAVARLGREMAFNQTCYGLVPKTDRVSEDYLYYALKATLSEMRSITYGTVFETITKKSFDSWYIPLPHLPEQRAIAHILGTLDDKIELNRRMNETLEQMARAIFKAWFVDFEPVRAKMEGRWKRGQSLPGLPAHLYDLFPDRLVDSELGEIPQGWKVGSVMDIIEISRNSILPLRYPDEFFDHFSIPAFDDGKMPVTQLGKEIKSNKFIVHPNSVLLSKLNPRIPRVWLPIVTEGKRSICSTEFIVAIPTNKTTREYIYALFSSFEFSRDFSLLVTGTSGSHQRVKPESLLSMCIVIPQSNIISEFTKIVKPFYKLCLNNLLQSATLSFLRNSLLPKLISGEIRIRDAERYLKERGL